MLSGLSVINVNLPEAIYNGKVLVTTAGARVQLTTDVTKITSGIIIKALSTNTGLIYIGDVSVSAANGFQLAASDTAFIEIRDRSPLYIDSVENGDGITYIATGVYSIVPSIASVSPVGGLPADDTKTITVTGGNFIGVDLATGVTIDGNPCTSVVVTSATTLTAVVPTGTVGAKTVAVTGVGGTGTLASGYTYEDAPTVTSITPNSGINTGGSSVTIAGTNFINTLFVSNVKIGGADCSTVVVVSDISITAFTPAGTAGAQDVVVTTASGPGTLAGGFTYITYANVYSMSFDGVDDNISTTAGWPEISSSGSGYSISLWLKGDPTTFSGWKTLFSLSDTSGKYRMFASFAGGNSSMYIYEGNADTVSFSSIGSWRGLIVVDELWHNYTFTSTGSGSSNGVKFYFDGVLIWSFTGRTLGSNLSTPRLFIASNWTLGGDIEADIDEVSMFDTDLSYTQVTDLYNDGVPIDLTTHANIKHWWRMGDGSGDTASIIYDQEGSWNLDSVTGAPVLPTDVPYILPVKVSPYYGDATTGAETITITGSNLAGVSGVSAGGNAFTSISASATSVTASKATNSGSDAVVDMVITDSTNSSEVTLPNGFVYRTGTVPSWTNAKSVGYNGSSGFATTENWAGLSSSGSGYSVSLWFKGDASLVTPWDDLFILKGGPYGPVRMSASFSSTTGDMYIYEGNADTVSPSSSYNWSAAVLADTSWHHYAFTSPGNGGAVKFYLDGALRITLSSGKTLGSNLSAIKLYVGCGPAALGLGSAINGNIDEVAIFGTELSSTAVDDLYNSGTPEDISAHSDIENYYRMGDSIGDTATLIRDQIGGMDLDHVLGVPTIDTDVP